MSSGEAISEMNDNKTGKRKAEGRSLTFSPRRENKPQMRSKLPERDQYIKSKLTDNDHVNHTATSHGQLEKFDRQSTSFSMVRRRPNKKQIQTSPSQKLNQLLLGKLSMTENKIKDTELGLKKLEDLLSETEQKLGCATGEKLSFVENLRKLLDSYDDKKSKMGELLSKNADLSETITDLNKRIVENSDFYQKEQVRFKNQIDTKEIENQRLRENIEKLTTEKKDMFKRVNELQVHLDHRAKLPKAICQECRMEIQNHILGTNSASHREYEEKSNHHHKSSHLKSLNRCRSAESSGKHHRQRKPIKSDSEIHNTSQHPVSSPTPLPSRVGLVSSARGNSNISTSSILSGKSSKMGQSRMNNSEKSTHRITEYENPRSNTNISSSSSFLSFANESEDILPGEWSRESTLMSFANSTYSR